jgi:hypothetical protein
MKYLKLLILTVALLAPCVSMASRCRKIIDYTIASAFMKESLVAEVEHLIKKGWQPYKGVTHNSKNGWMYQAMVKYEGEGNE